VLPTSAVPVSVGVGLLVALGPAKVGAAVTGLTVMVTVAVFESTVPSFALNVKLSVPLKPVPGV
jgi:hypothetical protein